jgi:hypothetical protein
MVFLLKDLRLNFFFMSIFLLFFLSGCSVVGNNSIYSSGGDINRDGKGLEINFNIDSKDIQKGLLYYDLSIKNSGDKKIVLTKNDNFYLGVDKTNIEDIIPRTEIDNFYRNIFLDSETIELYSGFNFDNIRGTIKVNKDYVLDPTNSDFKIILGINYPYKTDIFQNVEFDLKNDKIIPKDKIGQSSPLELERFELELLDVSNNNYLIKFFFSMKSVFNFNQKSEIQLNDLKLKIGSKELENCVLFKNIDGKIAENEMSDISNLKLNENLRSFEVDCQYFFEEGTEKLNTEVSGEINFKHKILILNDVKLPDLEN